MQSRKISSVRQTLNKEKILKESFLILSTIAFLERQIDQQILEFNVAITNHNYEEAEAIERKALSLIQKMHREEKYMDEFMEKYRALLNYEKEQMVRDYLQEE